MTKVHRYTAPNWQHHFMGPSSGRSAFVEFESLDEEGSAVADALAFLQSEGLLTSATYDVALYDLFVDRLRHTFDIPWTGISPRMRRLLFAVNSIAKPRHLVCAGVFCGYTYICNAAAAIGPAASYSADTAIGIELLPQEAIRAAANVARYAPEARNSIICGDAVTWLNDHCDHAIDLLYIDAKDISFDATTAKPRNSQRRSLYMQILQAASARLKPGSLILAHNSENASGEVGDYLEAVREGAFEISANMVIDDAGLEITRAG